jgi:hypothetical protein
MITHATRLRDIAAGYHTDARTSYTEAELTDSATDFRGHAAQIIRGFISEAHTSHFSRRSPSFRVLLSPAFILLFRLITFSQ